MRLSSPVSVYYNLVMLAKSVMKNIIFSLIFVYVCSYSLYAEVIERIPTKQKVVAITLDACETKTPSYLDQKIINFLIENKIPFTLFVSGKFIIRNKSDLEKIYKSGLVSLQNHSYNHFQHMEKLSREQVIEEVIKTEKLIYEITGKKSIYFRFPGGNYNQETLEIVERLGYKVVHWTFPSGDPDKSITADRLAKFVVSKTKPGSILIFHANGRGYSTPEALPEIIKNLKLQGYQFIRLEDYLK